MTFHLEPAWRRVYWRPWDGRLRLRAMMYFGAFELGAEHIARLRAAECRAYACEEFERLRRARVVAPV